MKNVIITMLVVLSFFNTSCSKEDDINSAEDTITAEISRLINKFEGSTFNQILSIEETSHVSVGQVEYLVVYTYVYEEDGKLYDYKVKCLAMVSSDDQAFMNYEFLTIYYREGGKWVEYVE